MQLLIKYEIVAFFILPFVLGILLRRGAITQKHVSLAIATHLSLIVGTYYLSLRNPETLFSVPLADWSVAIALSLFCWIFTYGFTQWLSSQWFQK
jgi:hypothetical protein